MKHPWLNYYAIITEWSSNPCYIKERSLGQAKKRSEKKQKKENSVQTCYSTCGSFSSRISFIWELIRKAESRDPSSATTSKSAF